MAQWEFSYEQQEEAQKAMIVRVPENKILEYFYPDVEVRRDDTVREIMRKHQPKQVGAFLEVVVTIPCQGKPDWFHNRGYPVQIQTKCLTGYPGRQIKKEIESMRQNESNLSMTTDVAVTTNTTNMEEKRNEGIFKNMKKVLPAVAGSNRTNAYDKYIVLPPVQVQQQ